MDASRTLVLRRLVKGNEALGTRLLPEGPPQSLVFQSMVKGNEDSGNEKIWRSFSPYFPQNTLMLSDSVGVPIISILFLEPSKGSLWTVWTKQTDGRISAGS